MSINVRSTQSGALAKQSPIFYPGDELHRIKQEKVQQALEAAGLDAFLFFKAEAVRYITDFYVKGFRPFMEPEYVVLVVKGRAPAVGYISGSDDLRIRYRSDIDDARKLPQVADWASVIGQMISDYGLAAARIGTDLMPYMVHDGLKRQFPGLAFVDASSAWSKLTAIKHPLEIDLIREAVRVADAGVAAAVAGDPAGRHRACSLGRSGLCHAQARLGVRAVHSARRFGQATRRCSSASRPRSSFRPARW